jgi:hypothetical protein
MLFHWLLQEVDLRQSQHQQAHQMRALWECNFISQSSYLSVLYVPRASLDSELSTYKESPELVLPVCYYIFTCNYVEFALLLFYGASVVWLSKLVRMTSYLCPCIRKYWRSETWIFLQLTRYSVWLSEIEKLQKCWDIIN